MAWFNWELAKVIFFAVGWWLIPLLFIFAYRARLRRYPIEAHILERRGNSLVYSKDMLGRTKSPTHSYKFKNGKTTIPIPKYDWVLQAVGKPTNLFEKFVNLLTGKQGVIFLFKYGSDQYKPINVKPQFEGVYFDTIDWDDINHMTQELRAIIMRRSKAKDFMEKYGPMIGLGIVAFMFIMAMYFGVKYIENAGATYIQATKEYQNCQIQAQPPTVAGDPITTPLDGVLGV